MTPAAQVEPGTPLSRRGFIKASALAAGGLLVALYLDPPAIAQESAPPPPRAYPPDAFVQIRPDGTIVIQLTLPFAKTMGFSAYACGIPLR